MIQGDCAHCDAAYWPSEAYPIDSSRWLECHELFHEYCTVCDEFIDQTDELCSSCQHLRLRHLLVCRPLHGKVLPHLYISLGSELVTEEYEGPCQLCELISGLASQDEHSPDSQLSLFLGHDRGLQVFERNGVGQEWTHVQDINLETNRRSLHPHVTYQSAEQIQNTMRCRPKYLRPGYARLQKSAQWNTHSARGNPA